MIRTVLRIQWLNLKRDYVALALTFVLPILFFSVFGLIYANIGLDNEQNRTRIKVIVVDEDLSELSRLLILEMRRL